METKFLSALRPVCRYGLARLHPLLAHAMGLREANSVTAMVTPLAMHFPVETLTIKVSPLKLQIKGNKLMRGAMRLLENRRGPPLSHPLITMCHASGILKSIRVQLAGRPFQDLLSKRPNSMHQQARLCLPGVPASH